MKNLSKTTIILLILLGLATVGVVLYFVWPDFKAKVNEYWDKYAPDWLKKKSLTSEDMATDNSNPFDNIMLPRGLRNNNPGNIKINNANKWRGKIPVEKNTDGVFEQFESLAMGARAHIALLRTYLKQGNNTIVKIVNKFAPTHDPDLNTSNPTQAYIDFVVKLTGIPPQQPVIQSQLPIIAHAMAQMENGHHSKIKDLKIYEDAERLI